MSEVIELPYDKVPDEIVFNTQCFNCHEKFKTTEFELFCSEECCEMYMRTNEGKELRHTKIITGSVKGNE